MKINFSLIFECEKFNQKLIDYSQFTNFLYQLGEKSHPHITILQFEYDNIDELKDIFNFFKKKFKISTKGLSLARFNNLDSIGIEVNRTKELELLQLEIISKLPQGINFINGTGEKFSPHITLCGWESSELFHNELKFDMSINYQSEINTRLVLASSDEIYQLDHIFIDS